jgi:oligoendopeptidase F
VDTRDTWNLTDLYPERQDCLASLDRIAQMTDELAGYKDRLTSSGQTLLEALELGDQMGILAERACAGARLTFDSDMGDPDAREMYARLEYLLSNMGEKLAYMEPELLRLPPAAFQAFQAETPGLSRYQWMMTKLFRQKEHVLSASEEELLNRMGVVGGNFDKIFDDLTVNDILFPTVDDPDGQPVVANEANYRKALESENRDFRRRFYDGLLGAYAQFANTITSILAGSVRYHTLAAKSRRYDSSLERAWAPDNIPVAVYDNLITTLRENLAPLREYLAFRQEALGYGELRFYDLFVPLVKGRRRDYTFAEARDIVMAAVAPLGKEYQATMSRAFSERWIDIYPNKGKATGAYATGVFDVHPYILLNFNGTQDDLFTLIHELGHAMHSHYSDTHQPFVDSSYCIFTAEVASTVNENLLFHYLLAQAQSREDRAYLLSSHLDSVRSTLYRQGFFADFERYMHRLAEADEPLVPQSLREAYRELYTLYYGPDFTVDDSLTYEWARIPHFYRPFYVYQYATGISAAICLARGILREGGERVTDYLRFLQSGGSGDPIDLLARAGVDLSTTAPIQAAVADFAETLAALKEAMRP